MMLGLCVVSGCVHIVGLACPQQKGWEACHLAVLTNPKNRHLFCIPHTAPSHRVGPSYFLELSTAGVLRTANASATIWTGPTANVTARAGATYWAFTAPDGGIYVVYGTYWADRDARIVVQCVPSSQGQCTAVPPNLAAATYSNLVNTVYRRVRDTGAATTPCLSLWIDKLCRVFLCAGTACMANSLRVTHPMFVCWDFTHSCCACVSCVLQVLPLPDHFLRECDNTHATSMDGHRQGLRPLAGSQPLYITGHMLLGST